MPDTATRAGAGESAARADDTRDRLIEAAAEVFSEKGYDGAGVHEIARRAGVTTGAIYNRFSGKAALLLEAIEAHTFSEFDALFASRRYEGRPTDILAIVGGHLVDDEWDQGRGLVLEAFVAARRDPELAALLRARLAEEAGRVSELVDDAKPAGLVDPDLDTESIATFCHSVALGFLLLGAVRAELPDQKPWEQLIERVIEGVADRSGRAEG